ncbi:DUF1489 family protein [Acidocella sp.]|uniref:DUF1489 family protein n=2 Tax=Acidocella sp. TaxID=50710 RepID=UPI00261AAA06|nr:DUF1489 domain-containing protein [Acidocella sp.]
MLHLIKLAVGVRDFAHLAALQASRAGAGQPLRTQTRNLPKRADELCDGGSLYWVIGGIVQARQKILGVEAAIREDGTRCAVLVLEPVPVKVAGYAKKAFQGWRYLEPAAAPPDVMAEGTQAYDMPEDMRRTLAGLGLL